MLPRCHRLSLRLYRHQLQKNNQVLSTPYFTLYYKPHSSLDTSSRFAIIVSKKLISSAVKRNYFRRQLLHHLQTLLPSFPAGYDFLIIPKSSSITLDYNQQKEAFTNLFSTIHLTA